jgi:hypothetical protein
MHSTQFGVGQHKGCPISRRSSNTQESKCDSMCRGVVSLFQFDKTPGRTRRAHLWTKGSQIQESAFALAIVFSVRHSDAVATMLDGWLQLSRKRIARHSLGIIRDDCHCTAMIRYASADSNRDIRPMYVVLGPRELARNGCKCQLGYKGDNLSSRSLAFCYPEDSSDCIVFPPEKP